MISFGKLKDINSIDKKFKFYSIIKSNTIQFRQRVKILVIDDQEFTPLNNLQQHGFVVHVFKNLPSIDNAYDYHIILCDLQGVGIEFNAETQGAHLIKEIKKAFPAKIVIAYTGGSCESVILKAKMYADDFLAKDANIEEWTDYLDKYIAEVMNPVYAWKKLRVSLLEEGITPYELAKLEDKFVSSLLGKNTKILDNYLQKINLSQALLNMLSTCLNIIQTIKELG